MRRSGEDRGAANVDRHRGSRYSCTIKRPHNDFKYLPGDLKRMGDKIVKFLKSLFRTEEKTNHFITTPIPKEA